jgi:signal recognition particle subunit SRP54
LKSVTPAQQFTKIVYDALVKFLGGVQEGAPLELRQAPPAAILLVGLQGSGKTTSAAKLAAYFKKKEKKSVLLVPADPRRPAAKEQLRLLAQKAEVEFFDSDLQMPLPKLVDVAMQAAKRLVVDVVIVDTAGRLAVDDDLMTEVQEVHSALKPAATLLVADSMTGQDAVNVAQAFHGRTPLSGVVLSKLDGDARGGAALSIKFLTGVPILFMGMGEGVDALEVFRADRLASRILDRGDVLSLVEKAQELISPEEAMAGMQKMRKGEFSLDDFLSQMRMMKKMGSMESIVKMLPGGHKIADQLQNAGAEGELKRTEAIILSMTKKERRNHKVLNSSRRIRIATGSGTTVADVNRLIKKFEDAQRMMSQLSKMGMLQKLFKN